MRIFAVDWRIGTFVLNFPLVVARLDTFVLNIPLVVARLGTFDSLYLKKILSAYESGPKSWEIDNSNFSRKTDPFHFKWFGFFMNVQNEPHAARTRFLKLMWTNWITLLLRQPNHAKTATPEIGASFDYAAGKRKHPPERIQQEISEKMASSSSSRGLTPFAASRSLELSQLHSAASDSAAFQSTWKRASVKPDGSCSRQRFFFEASTHNITWRFFPFATTSSLWHSQ